jgi:hypothetical protein
MAKTVKRYHSRKTGRYISRKQWLREGKRGKAKREKIVIGKRKQKQREITPPIAPGTPVVMRLQYQSKKRILDIEVVSVNGKIKSIRIGRRTYTQRASIILLKPLFEAAQISQGPRPRKTRKG